MAVAQGEEGKNGEKEDEKKPEESRVEVELVQGGARAGRRAALVGGGTVDGAGKVGASVRWRALWERHCEWRMGKKMLSWMNM